ncbi:MAG: HEAT repeat domain-containing protein [Planctomycetota bacterium]
MKTNKLVQFATAALLLFWAVPVLAQTDFDQNLSDIIDQIGHEQFAQRQGPQQAWEKLCLEAGAPGNEADRTAICAAMVAQLNNEISADARIFLLRQLEKIGDVESLPAIVALTVSEDADVCDAAIRALSGIPGPEAVDAIMAAFKEEERRETGLAFVKALGYRGDAQSVEVLYDFSMSLSPEFRDAAIAALVRIETEAAESAIRKLVEDGNFRPSDPIPFADAYLAVADRMRTRGDKETAAAMYRTLRDKDLEGSIMLAIETGFLNTCRSPGNQVEGFFMSDDPMLREVAAGFFSQLDDQSIMRLTSSVGQFPEASQIALLRAAGASRNNIAADWVMIAAERAESGSVRIEALNAMAGVGTDRQVVQLAVIMTEGGEEGEAAARALERMFADGVDERVVGLINSAGEDLELRKRLLQILDRRRATAMIDTIVADTTHEDASVRQLAVQIFSRLGSPEQISAMVESWQSNPERREKDEIEKAIVVVCRRIPEPDEQGLPVLQIYESAPEELQNGLLPMMGRIGTERILETVRGAAGDSSSRERYTAAVNALANWPDASVVDDLLAATGDEDESIRIKAVRALARVVVLGDERTDETRLELLQQIMELAERRDERDLIIDRARAVRLVETLRFVVPYLDDEDLQQRACRTIIELAHHRGLREPNQDEFDAALKRVIDICDDENQVNRAKGYMTQQ